MLDLIFNSAYVDFNAAYNFGNMLFDLRDIIYGDKPLASTMASAESAAKKDIENFEQNW